MERPPDAARGQSALAGIMHRNIHALLEERRKQDERMSLQQRIAARITAFTGSMTFVYIHAMLFGGWIIVNLGWIPGVKPFDPFPFVMLAMWASVEAIFLSTFVLISQNRMAELADRRADLDLQVSLLAEHEITRLIHLVDDLSRHLGARDGNDPHLEELKRDVAPEKVLQEMDKAQREEQ
jgi:uncharacterized membrane protein